MPCVRRWPSSPRSTALPRYKKVTPKDASLVVPDGVDGEALSQQIHAIVLARDLVNTPANDLGPVELEAAVSDLARNHGAVMTTIVGDDLSAPQFPHDPRCRHGIAAACRRLIDLTWGNPGHPKVTVVGKGVCFDTGGLNLKPDASMLLMKKDMGGAAAAIGLAHMIMAAKLPVRLRLLIAAVENSGIRPRLPSGRCLSHPQGHHRRDRQYRRRGPARPLRCADARR